LVDPGRVAYGGGADSMLQFWLERGDNGIKHSQKMKWRQQACLGSTGRKCDAVRQRDDISRRRGGAGEGKERKQRQLGWQESYWVKK
jgi:hypothetical protein